MSSTNNFILELTSLISTFADYAFPIILIVLPFYLLPTILAFVTRQNSSRLAIIAIVNVLLGWTLIAWLLCLRTILLNCESESREKVRPSSTTDATLAKLKSLS